MHLINVESRNMWPWVCTKKCCDSDSICHCHKIYRVGVNGLENSIELEKTKQKQNKTKQKHTWFFVRFSWKIDILLITA